MVSIFLKPGFRDRYVIPAKHFGNFKCCFRVDFGALLTHTGGRREFRQVLSVHKIVDTTELIKLNIRAGNTSELGNKPGAKLMNSKTDLVKFGHFLFRWFRGPGAEFGAQCHKTTRIGATGAGRCPVATSGQEHACANDVIRYEVEVFLQPVQDAPASTAIGPPRAGGSHHDVILHFFGEFGHDP